MTENIERMRTYIRGLDEKLSGGIPKNFIILVSGTHGTMKTSLCFNILYNLGVKENIKSLYLSFEQERNSLFQQMVSLGMNAEEIEKHILVVDIGVLRKLLKEANKPVNKAGWIELVLTHIQTVKDTDKIEVVVLDSLNAFGAFPKEPLTRDDTYHFFARLRNISATVFLISEMTMGSNVFEIFGGEPYLCDGIIHLDLRREKMALKLMLGIIKMRATEISRVYTPLVYDKKGFTVIPE
ncbi:MAG: ATPase domain-containing protein [Candidatus Thermoplasmatota archaeon]|nr:ATPase domain-containing protein [Candidatus Thermoplasmatota archaeon]MDI6855465.1 ATPase domain-containing protein [Candidatus Thermoplasmatota archaeon]